MTNQTLSYIRSVCAALTGVIVIGTIMIASARLLNDQETIPAEPPNRDTGNPEYPARLLIPALDIDSHVEHVGLDEAGQMAVPAQAENVAWYKRGASPGQVGNAVIAGHLDSVTGPAVFFELGSLRSGDEVAVISAAGETRTFIVEQVATYSQYAIPLANIFGPTDGMRLVLVTCAGQFNNQTQLYSHRTVVYATAK